MDREIKKIYIQSYLLGLALLQGMVLLINEIFGWEGGIFDLFFLVPVLVMLPARLTSISTKDGMKEIVSLHLLLVPFVILIVGMGPFLITESWLVRLSGCVILVSISGAISLLYRAFPE